MSQYDAILSFSYISEPTLTVGNLSDELKEVEELDDICLFLGVPQSKLRQSQNQYSYEDSQCKLAIIEDYIHNHPAPSWGTVADFLYRTSTDHDFGKYHEALQNLKRKYLNGRVVILSYTGIQV